MSSDGCKRPSGAVDRSSPQRSTRMRVLSSEERGIEDFLRVIAGGAPATAAAFALPVHGSHGPPLNADGGDQAAACDPGAVSTEEALRHSRCAKCSTSLARGSISLMQCCFRLVCSPCAAAASACPACAATGPLNIAPADSPALTAMTAAVLSLVQRCAKCGLNRPIEHTCPTRCSARVHVTHGGNRNSSFITCDKLHVADELQLCPVRVADQMEVSHEVAREVFLFALDCAISRRKFPGYTIVSTDFMGLEAVRYLDESVFGVPAPFQEVTEAFALRFTGSRRINGAAMKSHPSFCRVITTRFGTKARAFSLPTILLWAEEKGLILSASSILADLETRIKRFNSRTHEVTLNYSEVICAGADDFGEVAERLSKLEKSVSLGTLDSRMQLELREAFSEDI
jgi:hypothetical protein